MPSPGLIPGAWPATVVSYNQDARTCKVNIPGITNGAGDYPDAQIIYPVGDKSKAKQYATEVEILKGDTVWVVFAGGDPGHPVILGYRNPGADNSKDWRTWHHKNIAILSDDTIRIEAGETVIHVATNGDVTIKGKKVDVAASGDMTIKGKKVDVAASGDMTIKGKKVDITSDSLTHNGVNIGATHKHGGVEPGSGNTGASH